MKAQKYLGVAAQDIVRNFAELGQQPSQAIRQLNDSLNFLTVDVYKQIQALESQGRTAEAAALAQRTYYDEMQSRLKEAEASMGRIQRLGDSTSRWFKGLWTSIRQFIDGKPIDIQLREVEAEIQKVLSKAQRSGQGDGISPRLQELQARRADLEKQVLVAQTAATSQARQAARQAAEIAALDAQIEAGNTQRRLRSLRMGADVAGIQGALRTEVEAYRNQASLLDAQRAANLISDKEYYESKRRLIEDSASVQIRQLEAENQRISAETARITSAAQAAQQVADRMRTGGGPVVDRINDEAVRKQLEAQQAQIQNGQKIAANEQEILRIRGEAESQVGVLNVQETSRLTNLELGYKSARQAAADFLATQELIWQRELQGVGKGQQQRDFDAGRNAIDDRYTKERMTLERDYRNHPESMERGDFEKRRAIIDEFQAAELASYERHWKQMQAAREDASKGAEEALRNYVDESKNTAGQVEQALTNAFQGAEDALVNFVTRGKLSFSSLINSIISDLARIASNRMITSLIDVIAGRFGGGTSGVAKATGYVPGGGIPAANGAAFVGGVKAFAGGGAFTNQIVSQPTLFPFANGTGLMGEAGPEAIMPLKRMPGGKLGVSSTGANVSIQVNNYAGAQVEAREEKQRLPDGSELRKMIIDIVAADTAGGGKTALAARTRFGLREAV